MWKTTLVYLRRFEFLRREDGSIAIESMIILPMVFWSYLTLFSIFDAFRQYSINQKAAYTIGDMVSRETTPVNSEYMNGVQELVAYLARADVNDVSIRISSVAYDAVRDRFGLDWSQARGSKGGLVNSDVRQWHDKLPVMVHGERVMVVQTWVDYKAPFNTGLGEREIRNFVFTRPRYAPRVCWEQCN